MNKFESSNQISWEPMPEFRASEGHSSESALDTTKFQQLTTAFCDFIAEYGYSKNAYSQRSLNKFSSFSGFDRQRVLKSLESFLGLCICAQDSGIDLEKQSNQFVWWALKKFDLVPPPDLLERLALGVCVEIYNEQSIQIFRTLNVLTYMNYTLGDLLTYEWWELFGRDPFVTRGMLMLNDNCLNGKIEKIQPSNLPVHLVSELMTEGGNEVAMKHHFAVPVKQKDKTIGGFINCFNIFRDLPSALNVPEDLSYQRQGQ